MPVDITRRAPGSPRLDPRTLRPIAERMLAHLEQSGAELSILLTSDAEIRELNHEHRGKDKPTDVLAFPMDGEGEEMAVPDGSSCLGDVVISLDTAARQAETRKRPLLEEVRFLLAHGLLHLVGYDHANPEEKKEMTALTRQLVRVSLETPSPEPRKPRTSGSRNR